MLIVHAQRLNQVGPDNTGDYKVEVRVNSEVVWRGTISGHDRSKGWQALLEQIAERGRPGRERLAGGKSTLDGSG